MPTKYQAYDEWRMMADGASLIKMRYFAWYTKHVSEINKLYNEEDMKNYSKNAWQSIINEQVL